MAEVITLTEGADNYKTSSSDVTIQALGGNDTIFTEHINNVTISGGDGNDSLYNHRASNISMNGGLGNDIIYTAWDSDSNVLIGDAGNDTLHNSGANGWISGDDGADSINNYGDNGWINGGNGTDYIESHGVNATIYGGNDNDNIRNEGRYAYITGETGNDNIYSEGVNCTIFGGEGNDLISLGSSSHNSSINGGAGDDTIKVYTGSNISINGGYGNDLVSLHSDSNSGNVIEFSGDGSDTVQRFGVNDTLKIAGSYSSQISDSNVMIYVGNGSILLENAASLSSSLNIQTVPAGSFGDTTSTPTTSGGLTTGTNQILSNYTGEPVTVSGFMGAAFSGNNFVVNSSAGTLTIQNVTDKVVDLRNSAGGEFIKAYQASTAGVIDGRGINAYEIIQGASNGADVILAGDGGSQLWGGADTSADAIAGGNGSDIFIGGRFQGADAFYNVSSADAVNLTDASLSDIVGALEFNGTIAIGFNTGNIITIQSTDTLSAAINLADGTSWRYNHATKSWQGA